MPDPEAATAHAYSPNHAQKAPTLALTEDPLQVVPFHGTRQKRLLGILKGNVETWVLRKGASMKQRPTAYDGDLVLDNLLINRKRVGVINISQAGLVLVLIVLIGGIVFYVGRSSTEALPIGVHSEREAPGGGLREASPIQADTGSNERVAVDTEVTSNDVQTDGVSAENGMTNDLIRQELLDAAEDSLVGALNPEAVLNSALALASLDLDTRPPTQTDSVGRLAYPYVQAPDGLNASLNIRHTSDGDTLILGMRIEADRPSVPYIAHGYAREGSATEITTRFDQQGTLVSFSILTDVQPSNENFAMGIDPGVGQLISGVHYLIDPRVPSDWKAWTLGTINGSPSKLEVPVSIAGNKSVELEKVAQLAQLLQSSYQQLSH
jgi:hypothetical protein